MNATELLKRQHDEVKQLFEEFYPAVYLGDLKDELQDAVEEHLSVKRVIADLLEMNVEEEEFEAKMTVLKERCSTS